MTTPNAFVLHYQRARIVFADPKQSVEVEDVYVTDCWVIGRPENGPQYAWPREGVCEVRAVQEDK